MPSVDEKITQLKAQKKALEEAIILSLGKEILARLPKTWSLEEALGTLLAQPAPTQKQEAWAEALAQFHATASPQRNLEKTHHGDSTYAAGPAKQKTEKSHG